MKLKKYLYIIIPITFITLLIFLLFLNTSPEKAFERFTKVNNFYHHDILKSIDLNKDTKIYFWKNNYDQIAATIVEKNLLIDWKVTGNVGFVSMNKNNRDNYMWGKVMNSKIPGLFLGFVKNDNMNFNEITIDNEKANILKTDKGIIYFLISGYKKTNIVFN